VTPVFVTLQRLTCSGKQLTSSLYLLPGFSYGSINLKWKNDFAAADVNIYVIRSRHIYVDKCDSSEYYAPHINI